MPDDAQDWGCQGLRLERIRGALGRLFNDRTCSAVQLLPQLPTRLWGTVVTFGVHACPAPVLVALYLIDGVALRNLAGRDRDRRLQSSLMLDAKTLRHGPTVGHWLHHSTKSDAAAAALGGRLRRRGGTAHRAL
jgi:hypothetical protein